MIPFNPTIFLQQKILSLTHWALVFGNFPSLVSNVELIIITKLSKGGEYIWKWRYWRKYLFGWVECAGDVLESRREILPVLDFKVTDLYLTLWRPLFRQLTWLTVPFSLQHIWKDSKHTSIIIALHQNNIQNPKKTWSTKFDMFIRFENFAYFKRIKFKYFRTIYTIDNPLTR